MGMKYVIGYDSNPTNGKQRLEIDVNSTADIYLHTLISSAIEFESPDLYEQIIDRRVIESMNFDELNDNDFQNVIHHIRMIVQTKPENEAIANGVELWLKLIEPLISKDDRNKLKIKK